MQSSKLGKQSFTGKLCKFLFKGIELLMQSYYLFQSSLVLHEILKYRNCIELGKIFIFALIFVIKGQMISVLDIYMFSICYVTVFLSLQDS